MKVFQELPEQADYDKKETQFIVGGFTKGFPIGYQGSTNRRQTARNLPLKCGSPRVLWDKVMKEVGHSHYGGPFTGIPFDNFIQSPIGLVPKGPPTASGGLEGPAGTAGAGLGKEDLMQSTRLIFHLSHPKFSKPLHPKKDMFSEI